MLSSIYINDIKEILSYLFSVCHNCGKSTGSQSGTCQTMSIVTTHAHNRVSANPMGGGELLFLKKRNAILKWFEYYFCSIWGVLDTPVGALFEMCFSLSLVRQKNLGSPLADRTIGMAVQDDRSTMKRVNEIIINGARTVLSLERVENTKSQMNNEKVYWKNLEGIGHSCTFSFRTPGH